METAAFPEEKIDVLIMECTRGDHAKPEGWTRASEERRFFEALGAALERDACVLIPVFALGKTQEILAMLYKFRRQRCCPNFRFISASQLEVHRYLRSAHAYDAAPNARLKLMRTSRLTF